MADLVTPPDQSSQALPPKKSRWARVLKVVTIVGLVPLVLLGIGVGGIIAGIYLGYDPLEITTQTDSSTDTPRTLEAEPLFGLPISGTGKRMVFIDATVHSNDQESYTSVAADTREATRRSIKFPPIGLMLWGSSGHAIAVSHDGLVAAYISPHVDFSIDKSWIGLSVEDATKRQDVIPATAHYHAAALLDWTLSPDGRYVAYLLDTNVDGGTDGVTLSVFDRTTGKTTQAAKNLTTVGTRGRLVIPSKSPDTLLFLRLADSVLSVNRYSFSKNTFNEAVIGSLDKKPYDLKADMVISPDGTRAYWLPPKEYSIYEIELKAGAVPVQLKDKDENVVKSNVAPVISSDGSALYFSDFIDLDPSIPDSKSKNVLKSFDRQTKEQTTLTESENDFTNLAISPDDGLLVYTAYGQHYATWNIVRAEAKELITTDATDMFFVGY